MKLLHKISDSKVNWEYREVLWDEREYHFVKKESFCLYLMPMTVHRFERRSYQLQKKMHEMYFTRLPYWECGVSIALFLCFFFIFLSQSQPLSFIRSLSNWVLRFFVVFIFSLWSWCLLIFRFVIAAKLKILQLNSLIFIFWCDAVNENKSEERKKYAWEIF